MADAEQLDDIDRRLILELDSDPRLTVLALSERTGLARGTIQARLERYHLLLKKAQEAWRNRYD